MACILDANLTRVELSYVAGGRHWLSNLQHGGDHTLWLNANISKRCKPWKSTFQASPSAATVGSLVCTATCLADQGAELT